MEHRSHELLERFAVTIPSVRTEVAALSGGQRQQVAVARSLLGEPKIVLLDEPTAALGVAQTAQVLLLIKQLRERGLGVMVISHNLADVFEVADRVFVLRLGRPAGNVRRSPGDPGRGRRGDHRRPSAPGRRSDKWVKDEPPPHTATAGPELGPRRSPLAASRRAFRAILSRCVSSSRSRSSGSSSSHRTAVSSPRSISPIWCCRSRPRDSFRWVWCSFSSSARSTCRSAR